IAKFFLLLFLLAYTPVVAWWNSIPETLRTITLIAITALVLASIGLVVTLMFYKKHERATAWKRAMYNWQNKDQASMVIQKQSAKYLTETELEKFSAQVFSKMGYKAQLTGNTGDHGVDVMLVNPKGQKEIVQCKQWNKPVGEPQLRDLYGAMQHDQAVRGWLVAPRGFSEPAKKWAKGKTIKLIDDEQIGILLQSIIPTK
ncbi:MAG: restriction endonuclease, partial [Anaerolineales bacterium]|nr:restriction endonuclease [Anaerolineales bacterium]